MINSNIYNYVNVLDKAADASWLRQDIISNNIANEDTPGFKRQDVNFENILERELGKSKYISLDEKMDDLHMNHVNGEVYDDYAGYSYRRDRNNVDPEQEQVQLASNQIRYNGLIDSVGQEFSRIKSVIK